MHLRQIVFLFLVLAIALPVVAQDKTVRPSAVLISVTDNSGHAVRDLNKDQINVLSDNGHAAITDLRPVGDAPLSVGIVLLASKVEFAREQAAAIELIQKLIRSEQDHAFVVTAGGLKATQGKIEWQSSRDELVKEVKALDPGTGVPDAFNYELSTQESATATAAGKMIIETRQANDGGSVFDIAWGMMMADRRPARRVLVLFRSSWAHATGMDKPTRDYVERKHMEIIQAAQQLHVAVFSFGINEQAPAQFGGMTDIGGAGLGMNMAGMATRESDRQEALQRERLYNGGRANIERMTTMTGGRSFWSTKYLDDVGSMVNALSGQYLMLFVPGKNSPGAHELKVSSKKVKVSAPSAFLVGAPATK